MATRVAVLGGGIAGLSAAHELIERGFQVDVFEALPIPGGKARSVGVPGSGKPGPAGPRSDLPGEHGFRFFPRFYSHITDTMKRIPLPTGRTVFDNLVDTTRIQLARFDRPSIDLVSRCPRDLPDLRAALDSLSAVYEGDLGLSHDEVAFFAARIWQILTSCRERRMEEYEKTAWWDFIGAADRSPDYQALLGHGITRSLVAAKADRASTKTIGNIFVQLLFDIARPGPSSDRVLNGPTNDVWISPWLDYLVSRGLRYHFDTTVTAIDCKGGRIAGVAVRSNNGQRTVVADHYICALPIEDVVPLLTDDLLSIDPSLRRLRQLQEHTAWMNGVQIFLTEEVDIAPGHTIYVDSPWALTSISQSQFWRDIDLSQYGNGNIKGIISVDVSEWDQPGLNGKCAKDCSPQELTREVWEQLKLGLNQGGQTILRDEQLYEVFLDPSVRLVPGPGDINEEPLLVNEVGTWALRPESETAIPNLFLASDYVRTHTDLATMEAANEAARSAVNGVLRAAQSREAQCDIWKLHEPEFLAPWRALDLIRYEHGLPWDDTVVRLGLAALDFTQESVFALERRAQSRGDTLEMTGLDVSDVSRLAHPLTGGYARGSSSDLARVTHDLLHTALQLIAVRSAELDVARADSGSKAPRRSLAPSSSTRAGRVRIKA